MVTLTFKKKTSLRRWLIVIRRWARALPLAHAPESSKQSFLKYCLLRLIAVACGKANSFSIRRYAWRSIFSSKTYGAKMMCLLQSAAHIANFSRELLHSKLNTLRWRRAHIMGADFSIHCKSCFVLNNDALQKNWDFDIALIKPMRIAKSRWKVIW